MLSFTKKQFRKRFLLIRIIINNTGIFFVNNKIAFECPINSVRCIAHNSNGARCKRRVCIGSPYCFGHLPMYLHLKIMTSTIPH